MKFKFHAIQKNILFSFKCYRCEIQNKLIKVFFISVEQEDEKLVWILKTLSGEEEFSVISQF